MEHLKNCGVYPNSSEKVTEVSGITAEHYNRNVEYLLSFKDENLLLYFMSEAGRYSLVTKKTDFHWGWDSPLSPLRGQFTGHWLSAAAKCYCYDGNKALKMRADAIVQEIYECQKENGGEWAFGIPEKYLYRLRDGKQQWAPTYVCHKVMMGLLDMYRFAENETALTILKGCADWFYNFTANIERETMDDMMNREETGGIMEFWADLYGITGDEKHLELMKRYERPQLYEALLNDKDPLTNLHANATIPEIEGAARAYEVTGEEKYRKIVEKYWECAVTKRGMYVTGGQTCGEIWTPFGKQSARLSDSNQEHCVVYNMMRLSQYLYKWTKDTVFADYWERNLYNGIFAQGHYLERGTSFNNEDFPQDTGLVAYYLPLSMGSHKVWGTKTDHFWCCHGTLVQANASFHENLYYRDGNNIYIPQYIASKLTFDINGKEVSITQKEDHQSGDYLYITPIDHELTSLPENSIYEFDINGNDQEFGMFLRKPWWAKGDVTVTLNGENVKFECDGGHIFLKRTWQNGDILRLTVPRGLTAWPLADKPNMVAYLYGPVALAGLVDEERTLYGDTNKPELILEPDGERIWNTWQLHFKTVNQPVNFRFVPIYEIGKEVYTVYFPVEDKK